MSSRSEQRMGRRRTLKSGNRAAALESPAQAPSQGGDEEGFFGQLGKSTLGVLQRIDDSTQAFVRNDILRLPTDGSEVKQENDPLGIRQTLGRIPFRARYGYEGDKTVYRGDGSAEDSIGIGLSRALQGGVVAGTTAAGLALIDLTTKFGSQADYQEPNQLSL